MKKYIHVALLLSVVYFSSNAAAANLLDKARDYDLNNYALGFSLSSSANIYKGAEDSIILYPFLATMQESKLTDNWLVVGEGDVGFRFVRGDWTFGAVGRIQTLGFFDSDELLGVDQRRWALEMAPMVNYRAWPIQISFKPYFEVSDRHDGYVGQLEFSYPKQFERGYMTAAVQFDYMSDDYSNYYFGVRPVESALDRLVYEPGSVVNTELKFSWGYVLSEHWLINGRVGWLFLDDDIKNSPLIDSNQGWNASVGLAYNADVFKPRDGSERYSGSSNFRIKYTALRDELNTKIVRDASPTAPGTIIDVEDVLGLSNKETVGQLDVLYRFGGFHRLEFSYSSVERSGSVTTASDISVGDQFIPAATTIDSANDSQTMRISYGYSLLRDEQKELGITAGIHRTRLETKIFSTITGEVESNRPDPVLPTIGAYGSVSLSSRLKINAEGQFFRLDFDRYDGSLNYMRVEAMYQLGRVGLGLGYSYYSVKLDSTNSDFLGSVEFNHQGPSASIAFDF